MALIVEDGSGLSNAEAYASVVELDSYVTDFGLTLTGSPTTADKEVGLRTGTRDMDGDHKHRWKGQKTQATQALDWPRIDVQDESDNYLASDALPLNLKRANIELAIRHINGTVLTPDIAAGVGNIKRKKQQAGKVLEETEYSGGASTTITFTVVDNLLSDLVFPSGWVDRG